jgi:hypothetical protein
MSELGGGKSARGACGCVKGVASAANRRPDFVLRLMASAFGMQTASTKPPWVHVVEFLCRVCKSSDGAKL